MTPYTAVIALSLLIYSDGTWTSVYTSVYTLHALYTFYMGKA